MNQASRNLAISLCVLLPLGIPAYADEAQSQTALDMPEGLEMKSAEEQEETAKGGRKVEEFRVGGRLERVAVTRENGLNETYRNRRKDTIWAGEEDDLGDVPNMREWTMWSW